METNRMTPAQFTERYCPDYEEKKHKLNVLKSKANTPKYSMERGEICRQKKNLSASMFAEALENFRQSVWRQACEAQREECAGTVRFESRRYLQERLRDELYYACKNSDIPEPAKNE